MSKPRELHLCKCPRWGCSEFCFLDHRNQEIACPDCGNLLQPHNVSRFDAAEWDDCETPLLLVRCAEACGHYASKRKRRLVTCAMARVAMDWQNDRDLRLAIECGEALADGYSPPIQPERVRHALSPRWTDNAAFQESELALQCLAEPLEGGWRITSERGLSDSVLASIYHDFTPNPFVPLTWNPDWFTSTVRDLASHIYESREFTAMPILADALQDAGCDDEQILSHCRAEKPHARGCWVLDAILGKE